MLYIDGIGMGANWQNFLANALDTLDTLDKPQPVPPANNSSGSQNPVVAPIPVPAGPNVDPNQPTNEEISAASNLIQSLADQYRPKPPDITVDDDQTKAAQQAIQGAQTQYDNAFANEKAKQGVLMMMHHDPETTSADLKQAEADYTSARDATQKAQRELNVTADAGYMLAYGKQADADQATADAAKGDVADKLKALKALIPGTSTNDNYVPNPQDIKTAADKPAAQAAYDAWQIADAKETAALSASSADIANSNLAYAQLQSYASNPDYKDAMVAGVGRLNDALAPLGLQLNAPAALDDQQQPSANVNDVAKVANLANAWTNAAADALTLANAQAASDGDTGKFGGPVIASEHIFEYDQSALTHAQAAAATSGSYLQMLVADGNVDTARAAVSSVQGRYLKSEAGADLSTAQQQAQLAHDNFVATFGGSLALQYADTTQAITDKTANNPLNVDPKTMQSVVSALRAADGRLADSVNERSAQNAVSAAQSDSDSKKFSLSLVQGQYDDWNQQHGRTTQSDNTDRPPRPGTPVNPYGQALADAQNASTQADTVLGQAKITSELMHQQVLMDQFRASLPDNLLNPKSESDQADYQKRIHDFYEQHRSDMSQSLLDSVSQSTLKGQSASFGDTGANPLTADQQRNLIGTALGLQPDGPPVDNSAQSSDPNSPAPIDKTLHYSGDALSAINKVRDEIMKVGGANAQVSVMPVVYASQDSGMATTSLFKVTNPSGSTYYIDQEGAKYTSTNDYVDNNHLSASGTLDIATGYDANGVLQIKQSEAHHEGWLEKLGASNLNLLTLAGGMALDLVGGLLDASVVLAPLGVTLDVVGTGMIWGSVGASALNAGNDLYQRAQHDQSMSITDPGARSDYINLLPLGAAGAAKGIKVLAEGSRIAKLAEGAAKVSAWGGAIDAGRQTITDAVTGHTDRVAGDVGSVLENVVLLKGHEKLEGWSQGLIRRNVPYGLKGDGGAVRVDGQKLGVYAGPKAIAAHNYLTLDRTAATLDGRTVGVARDGTLMVGHKAISYDGMPVRVRSPGNPDQVKQDTLFVDQDGNISKYTYNRFGPSKTEATGEKITFGTDGSLTLSDKLSLASTKNTLLPSAPAPKPPASRQNQNQNASQSSNPTQNGGNSTSDTQAIEASATTAAETATTAQTVESRVNQGSAQILEQQQESAITRNDDTRADQRRSDQQQVQFRRVVDPHSSAGAGAPSEASPVSFKARIVASVLNADEPMPVQRSLIDSIPTGEPPQADPTALPFDSSHSIYVVRAAGMPESAPRTAAVPPRNLSSSAEAEPPVANSKALSGSAPNASGPIDLSDHVGELAGYTVQIGAVIKPASTASFMVSKASAPKVQQRGPATQAEFNSLEQWRLLSLQTRTANGLLSPSNRIVARLTVPNEIRVNRETALEAQGLSLADEVAPNETNLAAPGVSSEPGNAATSEAERHTGTLVAAGAGSRAGLQMPHPAMAGDAGAPDAPKPRLIERIQMRMGGAPLPNEVSALAQQSGTLSQQLRLLNENGWKVRRGKPGSGSRIDTKRRRVTIDGRVRDPGAATYVLAHETQHAVEAATGTLGLDYSGKRQFTRSALEAEARAQLNAFESRYEISLSGGGDIGEHAGLPESIEREYSNWHAGNRTVLAQRLSAAFAEAPVSIQEGKTYQAFYDEVWASQNARTMPAPDATEARLPATFRERTDWSRENAQEDSPFEGSLLSGKHPDHSVQMGPVSLHQYEGQNLYVVRGSGTTQGELHIGDGPVLSGHEFTVRSRYTFPEPYEMREPVILSVANAELKFAPELANVWQKSIFVAPEGAIGSDGQLRATNGYLRIDPAPYQLRDLGPLTANTNGIFFDGEAHGPVDLAEHLGALIGFGVQKGGFELGANAVVGVYSQGGTTAADHVQAATTEFESLERLRFLGLRTLTMDGVFSVANRVAVLYQPRGEVHSHEVEAAYAHLRNQFTSREVAAGKLPANIRRTTLDQFDTIRRIVTQEKLAFDFQGIYRDGHFYLSDPNRIEYGADEYHDAVLQKIDEQINAIARGIAERKILVDGAPLDMPHPAMAEKGPYSSKPGLIDRIRMRLFGAPLPDEVSALVSQSSTLSNQLRMLDSKGWKVVRGKPGSGSRISTKTKTVTIDGGLRDAGSMTYVLAHEARHAVEAATGTLGLDYGGQGRFTRSALQAEARAQLNAFEARYQISLASGVDIAARTSLPEAIEREYGNWATGDRAELTQRLSEAFAEAPVSVKGGQTYQTFYDEVWARQKTHTPSAMASPDGMPHPDGQTQGAAGASDAGGVPRSSPALDQPPLYASETHDDLTGIPKVIHPADRITSAPPLAEHGVRKLSVGHPAFDFSSTPENTYESVTLRPGFADALTNRPGVLGDVARVMRPGGRVTLERPSGLLEEPDPRAAIDATARELEAAGFVNVRTEFVTGDGSTVDLGNLSNDPGSLDPEAGYLRFSGDVHAEPANAHDGLRKLLEQALAQGVGSADDVYGLYNKVPAQEAARFSLSANQQGRYLDQLRQLVGDRPDGSVEAVQTNAGIHDSIADFLAENPGFGGGYYHFMPPEGVGPEYDDVQERVYINATPEHAPDVMRFLVKDIMDRPEDFPGVYSAKIAGPKSAPGRSENIVVYITDAHDRQPVVDALAAYQQAHPDHFRSDVPHMTEGALRGVSTAAEVSADMKTKAREAIASARGVDVSEVQDDFSFGEQRAEAIWLALRDTRARQNEAGPNFDATAYLRARTGQRLAQFGVDPSNPARNLAPADYVSVDAHAVDERTVRLTTVDGHAVDVRVYGGARGARPTRLADIRMPGQPDSRQPFELLHDPETGEPAIIRRIMGAAESPEPQPTPAATPSVRPVDTVLDQVETLAEGKRVVVFGGYSGLGYRDVDALKAHIASTLNAEVAAHGAENLLVVAGATSDGIGVAYEVAKSHGLATAGIVSEAAREFGASPYCDQVIYVPDPHENWQVMAPDGRSYMLSIAQDNGIYYAFGGGDVTVAELAEARERNIPTEVDASFEPDQDKLNKRLERAPDTNPTPVRTWLAAGVRHAGTPPVPADSSERLPSSFDERVAYSLAHARPESPFAGGQAPDAASLGRRMGATTLVPGHQLIVLHAEGSPDGRLMLGGQPVPTHDYLLDTRETPRDVDFGWILSARYADVRSAAEMANIWQMPIYAPHTEAVQADGTLLHADAMRRYDPAPYALPDLGRLAVDRQGVHAADDPTKRIDVERYLGAMLGIGSEKAVYELSVDTVVGLYDKAPFTRRANLEAARNEWDGLVMLRKLGLRTVAMLGPFSVANRLAVLYRPRAVLDSFEVIENGTLPKRVTQATIDHLTQIRATVEREKLRLDLQGLFTENGHFYLSDPGKVVAGSDGYRESLDRADRLLKKLLQGLKRGDIELAHPAMTEDLGPGGDYAPRPSLITRILMLFRGVPVSGDVSALAQHSSLLSEHMRLLSDHGWQVKMGHVGGGSKINERRKQIVIDGGLRRTGSIVYSLAHEVGHAVDAVNGTLGLDGSGKEAFVESALEAEARAQAVAFRVRDEIKAAQEIDIAEHVRLPDAIEREAGRARADDPASLERLAAAFADAPTSLKGNRTYRQHYEAAWAKQRMRWHTADGIEMPAPTTPNPPAVPGGSAPAERAARWLDARGLRKLQRVEGARVSNLADLAVEAGPGAHVLIAERSARRAGEQPTFIAHTQLDEHGVPGVPGEIHPTAPGGKLPPVVKRALSHLDTSNKSVKARGKLDFYISPVPLETLNAFGGAAEIAETGVPETEKLPVAATSVSQQVEETIGKLAGVQHFASARQAANHAVHDTDTIYAVDAKTGVPLGHARKIDDAWQYTENAPVAGTRVAPAKLKSAFREHAGRVPMPWTSRKGVRFVISDQSPETVEAFGGFDPMLSKRAARKAEKPARDPHRSGADLTLLGIYKGRAGLHALARLREAQRAAHRTEAAARKVSPVTRGIAPNLLPEQPLHAVNFRGINFVHLLRASELGAIKEGKHHIYVYDSEGDIAHMTNNARGRLEMRGKELRWFGDWKHHDANAPGVSIDESPIGRGPHGANMQFLLTELDPKALEAHAKVNKGTGLLGARRRTTDIEIKPYQPALSSATVTELIARYGKIKESWLFPQLAALKEYASRKRNASATPVELTDAAVDRVPDVVVADATQWKALHLPLHVARDDSPNGLSQFSALPTRRAARLLDTATGWQARLLRNYVRAGRRLSVATVSDTKLIRHFLAADPAVQDRVAPMGRAFTLLDNPEQAVERVKRTGGAMPVVTLVVDPNTLNAAQGKKHDPQFVAAVKRLGALKGATVDYENGVIRGANNEVLPLDHLNEKTLFAWLDAAREAGFALRLETAPSRHLVSAHDKAIQAGTNDSYHDYVRTFSLLEDWAKRNAGTRAPQVMVTFHGWDTVLESVPGGGHAKLVEAVLDRQTLNWVHMGLGYGTHGSDSIANEELTTALARLIVKYAGQPEKLARIHGDDALTRVFDRPAASLLVEQQRPLLIELDRVGREDGLPPAAIARIRERIYQRNTTDFVNQARLAETTYAQRHWNPSGNGKAQAYARRWMTDVGSHLQNPGNRTLPSAPGKLTPWAQIVSDPALKNDAKKAVSESRETAAQLGQDEIAKDEQALAELTALHLAPIEKNWRTRFLTGATIVGLGGVATVLGTNQFNLFDTLGLANLKTATPHLLTATRIARMFQAAHQASVRSLQNGDPRVFDKVADTLVERLSSQLPNYDRTSKRSAQLQLLADEGKANVARIRWLHKEHGLSYTDAVEQTQIIVGDMLGQMQGAFTGTALKQIHQGNPRHWLGTAARISALAGYTGTLAMDIHALAGNDPWLTVLPTAGVLLSGTYTGMVLLGRRQGVNVDQRSRVARFADSASDAFTASGGLLGATSQLIENHWFAGGTAAASSLILSAGWLNARFPNATPKVSKVPIWLALLPIGIFIGNQIAPLFMNGSNSSGSGNTGPQPPASTNTPSPSASASPSPGVSASPTTGASASPAPSASPSTPATPGASPSPSQPGQPVQTPQPTPTVQRYLVAEGDSLWVIADHNRKTLLNAAHVSAADQQGMSEGEQDARALQEIFQLNPQLAGGDANLVYPGQQIVIG
ncbi:MULTISPECIES: LWXIA domain-containing protein [Paraburkholderia]|uniref:LWXIA domain-containing protein n=1 Tax=Paraburkholderia TaxID=1822464 RepID=UPI002250EDBC|nr:MULTISPECIES: LWXIA domain-containing protein [Paraburkholderia]MCX4173938.1 LWXIA domain-containing protein [Paraburkholderia madseniana]MDQ6461942.1 LWXIA domain-containing protein [Paraburkholderia madseniana]